MLRCFHSKHVSQTFPYKAFPIRNTVNSWEKYKPDYSQIHIKVEYWMLRCFQSKHIESDLSLQRVANSKTRSIHERNTISIVWKSEGMLKMECWEVFIPDKSRNTSYSKLVLPEIWGYLQRNTASVPHKYLWIESNINLMMMLSSLLLPDLDFILPIQS